jgi:hypothetical protein
VSSAAEDPFDAIDRMLGEQQMKHFEMAGMVGEYRDMLSDLRERHDEEALKLARNLPGARYHVATTYVRENWLKLQAELTRAFPAPE